MLTHAQNEALTRVEGDAPMGQMLRKWAWFPFAVPTQLTPGAPPMRVRLVGSDYVAWRSPDGRIGFIDEACPHRNVSMALARNEGCHLRCIFHGWAVDVDGKVVDAPTHQPNPEEFAARIKPRNYPVREEGGFVWVWLGGEPVQPFPQLPFVGLPENHTWTTVTHAQCNWLQGIEGSLDSAHVGTLHKSWIPRLAASAPGGSTIGLSLKAVAPRYEVDRAPFGLSATALRELDDSSTYVRTTQYVAPFVNIVPGAGRMNGSIFIAVPVDDYNHLLLYGYFSADETFDDQTPRVQALIGNGRVDHHNFAPFAGGREDNWGQDRALMDEGHHSGFGNNLLEEDFVVQASMGRIADRTREHLSSSDVAIVQARMMLLQALKNDAEGRHPLAPYASNWLAQEASPVDTVVPPDSEWRQVLKREPVS
ncbi:MAG: hypothetical protein JWO33_133 [Caulobacteraceae bacterium]|nr:hypothetical protein [Caulobacteraceae bacterium]